MERRDRIYWAALGAGATLAVLGLSIIELGLLTRFFPAFARARVDEIGTTLLAQEHPWVAVLVAPVAEELLFRWAAVQALRQIMGLRAAIILSAVVFGLLHPTTLSAVLYAVAMSLVYVKSGTILLPIVLHAANNAVAMLGEADALDRLGDPWFVGAHVACALLGAPALWRLLKTFREI